ncbi:MAG: hypothetical protein HRU12_24795, partial [Phaeodactylibacter sp.]|nr:hypothetical protein [Phaeodactylibacter sp.]
MKSIITSTLALFLSVFVFAQNEITVSGTVANTDGTPVEGLEVLITSDSLTSGGFFSAVALTDANGDYSITVQLADADSQGWVYASIADCNQSFLYGSGTWSPGNSEIVIDFTYCDIQLSCYAYVFPDWENNVIAATMIGAPPFTYEWSNGETTESVLPDGSGLYCVTITDDLGCESSACYDASGNGPDSSCVVILVTTPTATGLEIEAMPYTIGTTTYLWSTGETTETIEVTDPGTYCVTATDSEGCVATACTEFFAEQCDVTIDINATGTMLIALPTGEAPFTYSWSTGSTLQESDIDPNVSFYSVVVTDAAGCVSTANYWYQGGGTDSCFVEIIPVQNGTMLEVIVSGATGSISYEWSTGDTTPFLQDVQPGYYCVTVTSDNGCAETACILVEDPNAAFIIEGYVYLPDSINGGLMEGWAYLIVYDEEAGTLTAV